MTARLEHGGKVYGLLSACIPVNFATEAEERSLFEEVAGDIAFALHSIELEEGRKWAEEALKESEKRFQDLFKTMSEGVILMDAAGQVLKANPAAERIAGIKSFEIEGVSYDSTELDFIRSDGSPLAPEEMAGHRAMKEKRSVIGDVMGLKNSDGTNI